MAAVISITPFLFSSGTAAAAPSAVSLHQPDLPAAATVWCLHNPRTFAVAAKAIGLQVGERPKYEKFNRPNGRAISIEEWAESSMPEDVQDFNAACLPAYEAFGPSGGSGGSGGVSDEEWFGLVSALAGALVGAAAATGGSAGIERFRSRRQDGSQLRKLSRDLLGAIGNLAENPSAATVDVAGVRAHTLGIALDEWQACCPDEARKAQALLKTLLGAGAPSINNPTGNDPEAKEIRKWARQIDAHVAAVARRISRFR